jgi:soluble lytic murein transglycosylase-like protein
MDSGLRETKHTPMVNGTQRVNFPIDFGDHAVGVGRFGGVDQLAQESFRDAGHIAGDEKIPVGLGMAQGSVETAQRSAIFDFVGDHRQAEMPVFFGGPDQDDISGRAADLGGDLLDHGDFAERQESLIAPHAPAGSADQNKPRSHEMILATSGHIVLSNKKVYICFLTALAMAASPSRAAEVTPAITAPPSVVHKTQVVRADPRTGKLVRSVVVSSRPVITKITPPLDASGADLNAIVEKAAKAHEVDPLLVHSIIKQESNYNVHAVSNKGAQGLMQLTPSTARMLGVSNSFDPQQNIEAGVKYLKYLKDLYKDDRLALAAYNAGPGAVDKYKWIPPYAETQNYVYQVGKRYGDARRAADAAKPVEVKAPEMKEVDVKPVEVKPAPVETFVDENGRLHLKTTQ